MTAVTPPRTNPDEDRVHALVDEFLAANDPNTMSDEAFRGAQYDAGLAWVHFPTGWGGLDLPPDCLKHIVVGDVRLAVGPAEVHLDTLAAFDVHNRSVG